VRFKVVTLRTVHEQLTHLLSVAECQQLKTSEAFLPFSGLNPLHYNPYTEPLWRAAVVQYEKAMMPAEQKIAGKLRDQFRQLSAHSHQVRCSSELQFMIRLSVLTLFSAVTRHLVITHLLNTAENSLLMLDRCHQNKYTCDLKF
jgi:dynein heavy chain 2